MPQAGLPRFVPGRSGGPVYRLLVTILRLPVARSVGMACARRFDGFFKALISGPFGPQLPIPFATMTNVGARSGEERQVALLYFNDGDDVILIGSNFGGAKHPAWYHNLRANPDTTVRRGRFAARYRAAEVVDPAEHERLYRMAEAIYPGYAVYRRQTAVLGRRIPIMRLRLTR